MCPEDQEGAVRGELLLDIALGKGCRILPSSAPGSASVAPCAGSGRGGPWRRAQQAPQLGSDTAKGKGEKERGFFGFFPRPAHVCAAVQLGPGWRSSPALPGARADVGSRLRTPLGGDLVPCSVSCLRWHQVRASRPTSPHSPVSPSAWVQPSGLPGGSDPDPGINSG